ncbi:Uncharacterised protein [Vibrio cholerae]|nr:Uncharacterised protein [Vibrio cholerae]
MIKHAELIFRFHQLLMCVLTMHIDQQLPQCFELRERNWAAINKGFRAPIFGDDSAQNALFAFKQFIIF